MTDIWDEKPKTNHAGAYGLMTNVYGSGTMDAFHEKVKAELDKLEAVKTLCEPAAKKGVLSTRGRKKLAIDILKILTSTETQTLATKEIE